MNRLGIVVDVSHASDRTTWDILETATGPVIASHSNARALCDHPRNLTDEMIHAIAATSGLVGIVAVDRFIAAEEPTIGKWVDHLDHMVRLVGIDHVGIGCDFFRDIMEIGASQEIPAWSPDAPNPICLDFAGMSGHEDLPGLTAELRRRGYAEADMRKLFGENALRVLRSVVG